MESPVVESTDSDLYTEFLQGGLLRSPSTPEPKWAAFWEFYNRLFLRTDPTTQQSRWIVVPPTIELLTPEPLFRGSVMSYTQTGERVFTVPYTPENIVRAFFISKDFCQRDSILKASMDIFLIKTFLHYNPPIVRATRLPPGSATPQPFDFSIEIKQNMDMILEINTAPANYVNADSSVRTGVIIPCREQSLAKEGVTNPMATEGQPDFFGFAEHDSLENYEWLKENYKRLRIANDQLKKDYDKLSSDYNQFMEKNKDDLQKMLDDAVKAKTQEYVDKLQECQSDSELLAQRATDLLQESRTETAKAEAQLKKQEMACEEERLAAKLESQRELNRVSQELDKERESSALRLETELTSLRKTLEEEHAKVVADLKSKHASELASSEAQASVYEASNDKLNKEKVKLLEQIGELQGLRIAFGTEFEAAEARIKQLKDEKAAFEDRAARAEERLQTYQQASKDTESTLLGNLASVNDNMNIMQATIAKLQSERDQSRAELQRAKTLLADQTSELQRQTAELVEKNTLAEKLARALQESGETKGLLMAERSTNSQLRDDLMKLSQQIESSSTDASNTSSTLSAQIARLTGEVGTTRALLVETQSKNSRLEIEVESLLRQIAAVKEGRSIAREFEILMRAAVGDALVDSMLKKSRKDYTPTRQITESDINAALEESSSSSCTVM